MPPHIMEDQIPFDDVYERYGDRIYHFCLLQVHDPGVAEDLAAQTFMAAFAAYDKRRPDPGIVGFWLFRIARNLVSDHRRREKRRERVYQIIGRQPQPHSGVEQLAEVNSQLAGILEVLAQMKERERRLIALRAGGGLTFGEIGEMLGLSEHAAMMATHRALDRFRALRGEAL
jgi:RNA polymerase sigma-70 factor (ECF subfamily)